MESVLIFFHEKFRYVRHLKNKRIKILDIGCGNQSPKKTKKFFRNAIYHGLDLDDSYFTKEDRESLDKFFKINLNTESLDDIPEDEYDYVILSHVLEHLINPYAIVRQAAKKVKRNGYIYIEFPSLKSFNLPSMRGTLHFCDDPTHRTFVKISDVVNILLDLDFKILKAGRRRNWLRILFLPCFLIHGLIHKKPLASYFWDILGFADQILAKRITKDKI